MLIQHISHNKQLVSNCLLLNLIFLDHLSYPYSLQPLLVWVAVPCDLPQGLTHARTPNMEHRAFLVVGPSGWNGLPSDSDLPNSVAFQESFLALEGALYKFLI